MTMLASTVCVIEGEFDLDNHATAAASNGDGVSAASPGQRWSEGFFGCYVQATAAHRIWTIPLTALRKCLRVRSWLAWNSTGSVSTSLDARLPSGSVWDEPPPAAPDGLAKAAEIVDAADNGYHIQAELPAGWMG